MPLLQRSSRLRHALLPLAAATALLLSACAGMAPGRPASWAAPQPLVAPSSFTGVHGLAVDKQGRLLAGSVVGNAIWEVDRNTGAAKILVGGPDGQADDIAIAPNGAMAWTNYLQGAVRIRDNDQQASRVIASGLPGLNSLAFDPRNGKLYATQVFLGDALWELDPSGARPPRSTMAGSWEGLVETFRSATTPCSCSLPSGASSSDASASNPARSNARAATARRSTDGASSAARTRQRAASSNRSDRSSSRDSSVR